MRFPLLALLVIGALAAGYVLGLKHGQAGVAAPASSSSSTSHPGPSSHSDPAAKLPASAGFSTLSESLDHDTALRVKLAGATGEELLAALQQRMLATPSARRESDLRILLEAWARRDPRAALAFAEKNFSGNARDTLLSGVIGAWVRQEPEAALTWATAGGRDPQFFIAALESLAETDPQRALELTLASRIPEEHKGLAYATIFKVHAQSGRYDDVIGMLQQIPAGSLRDAMNQQFASTWARYEPAKAASWALALPESGSRDQALINLAGAWSETDPRQAAAFAASLPAGDTRRQALAEAFGSWVNRDLVAASDWLDQFGAHPDNDPSVAMIATEPRLVQRHPETALSWAESISGTEVRLGAIQDIVGQWGHRDASAATHYLQTSPAFTPEQRTRLLEQLAQSLRQPEPDPVERS